VADLSDLERELGEENDNEEEPCDKQEGLSDKGEELSDRGAELNDKRKKLSDKGEELSDREDELFSKKKGRSVIRGNQEFNYEKDEKFMVRMGMNEFVG